MIVDDLRGTGAFGINEEYATAIRWRTIAAPGEAEGIELRFVNDHRTITKTTLSATDARELLGARNYATLQQAATDQASVPSGDGTPRRHHAGELRGAELAFRQVTLPGYVSTPPDNAILLDERSRAAEPHTAAGSADRRANDQAAPRPRPMGGDGRSEEAGERRAANAGDRLDGAAHDARLRAVPQSVERRFLRIEDRFYFPDRTLAFVDRGTKLSAETNNREVLKSLVTIAETRGWTKVRVTGSDDFRREVWRLASSSGIAVEGYAPDRLEQEAVQKSHSRPNQGNARFSGESQPSKRAATAGSMADRQPTQGQLSDSSTVAMDLRRDRLQGRFVRAGPAPYRFDKHAATSYFLTVATANGKRTVWGLGLEEAINRSATRVQPGDEVAVENTGPQPELRKDAARDGVAPVDGANENHARPNRWLVERPEYFAARAEKALAFRMGSLAQPDLLVRYPDLAGAVATLKVGELFAERLIDRPDDRARLVTLLRTTLADALERGETIEAPKVKSRSRQSSASTAERSSARLRVAAGPYDVEERSRAEREFVRA